MSESPDETSLWREILGRNEFDDRIDTQSDITNLDAFRLLGRCVMLITEVRGLFAAKFLLQLGLVFPVLLLPWMAKIVVDNVILAQPFGTTEVLYPPFMNPILALVQGREPMDIMLILTTIYFVMLVTIGSRFGGTGASLLDGRDAATQSENATSQGGSEGGSFWGVLSSWSTSG